MCSRTFHRAAPTIQWTPVGFCWPNKYKCACRNEWRDHGSQDAEQCADTFAILVRHNKRADCFRGFRVGRPICRPSAAPINGVSAASGRRGLGARSRPRVVAGSETSAEPHRQADILMRVSETPYLKAVREDYAESWRTKGGSNSLYRNPSCRWYPLSVRIDAVGGQGTVKDIP